MHGRFTAIFLFALLASLSPSLPAQTRPESQPAPGAAQPKSALKLTWTDPDHASGIYYPKSDAKLTLLADNPTAEPLPLEGNIEFGAPDASGLFTSVSTTPLAPITIPPKQRATIPLTVTFAAAGEYELRWSDSSIQNPGNLKLLCIFAPRTTPALARSPSPTPAAGRAPIHEPPPWLATLPTAALNPGFLRDYVAQTSVRRFFLDERFVFDSGHNIGLGFGASLGGTTRQLDALFQELAAAEGSLILRIRVPVASAANPAADLETRTLAAFRQYVLDAVKSSRGTLKGIAISPEALPTTAAQHTTLLKFYLGGYEAAKKQDRSVALLGAGTATSTELLIKNTPNAPDVRNYIDALAITDVRTQPALARRLLSEPPAASQPNPRRIPLWLIPPQNPWNSRGNWAVPPAAALAEGLPIVAIPPPAVDHGVTAHLLGASAFLQMIPIGTVDSLPFVAVFQGEGFAVAAIAGISSGTPADALYPGLARTRTGTMKKGDDKPEGAGMQISDDTRTMRVVDDTGAPLDCRTGDTLSLPLGDRVNYVLQAGLAQELAGSLRASRLDHLPFFDIQLERAPNNAPNLILKLHNLTDHEIAGTIQLGRPPSPAKPEANEDATLGEKSFAAIPAGATAEISLDLQAPLPDPKTPIALAITTSTGLIQVTALLVEPR